LIKTLPRLVGFRLHTLAVKPTLEGPDMSDLRKIAEERKAEHESSSASKSAS